MADPFYDTVPDTMLDEPAMSVNDQTGFFDASDGLEYWDGYADGYRTAQPMGIGIGRNIGRSEGFEDGYENGKIVARYMTPARGDYSRGKQDGLAQGKTDGQRTGIGIGRMQGQSAGYEDGFSDGIRSGTKIGAVAGGDTVPPVVTVTSYPTTDEDPVIVQVYDATGLRLVQLTCQDRVDGPKQIVYDDTGFQHPFGGKSTVTGAGTAGNPLIFTIFRRGRWPTGIALDFKARAIDTSGNQASA